MPPTVIKLLAEMGSKQPVFRGPSRESLSRSNRGESSAMRERERRRGGGGGAVESLVRGAAPPSRAPGPRAGSRDGVVAAPGATDAYDGAYRPRHSWTITRARVLAFTTAIKRGEARARRDAGCRPAAKAYRKAYVVRTAGGTRPPRLDAFAAHAPDDDHERTSLSSHNDQARRDVLEGARLPAPRKAYRRAYVVAAPGATDAYNGAYRPRRPPT